VQFLGERGDPSGQRRVLAEQQRVLSDSGGVDRKHARLLGLVPRLAGVEQGPMSVELVRAGLVPVR
jgi:hypothetical protein